MAAPRTLLIVACSMLLLWLNVGQATTEDFTTWTAQEQGTELTVTTDSVAVDPLAQDLVTYTYKDYGASYFETEQFHFVWNGGADASNLNQTWGGVFGLSNAVGNWATFWYQSSAVVYWNQESSEYKLRMRIGSDSAPAWGSSTALSISTDYYCSFYKAYTGGTNGTGLYTLYICTGDFYGQGGVLVDTVIVSSPAAHQSKFRYAYAILSRYRNDANHDTSGTISYLTVGALTVVEEAPDAVTTPSPSTAATGVATTANLTWASAYGATNYNVYFGALATDTNDLYVGNTSSLTYDPTLSYATDYHWRVDANNVYGTTRGTVYTFSTRAASTASVGLPGAARGPFPGDTSPATTIKTDLEWTAVSDANDYNVYFGVASTAIGDLLVDNVATNTYAISGDLEYSTDYHWRIDANDVNGVTTGDVWTFTTAADAGTDQQNHFEVDPNLIMLLRFESTASLGTNGAGSADGVVAAVTRNTTYKKEYTSSALFGGAGAAITFVDANQPDSLLDGDEFSMCGWLRLATTDAKTLMTKGATGTTNLSASLAIDGSAKLAFSLGKTGDAGNADTYTHQTALVAGTWYWFGVSVDPNNNVLMRLYKDGTGIQGTDIDTAVVTDYEVNTQDLVFGPAFTGYLDEIAVFDDAIDFDDMNDIIADEYLYSTNRPFTYYMSPTGDNANIGTSALPWGPLSEVRTADVAGILGGRVRAGDRIKLQTGEHGQLDLLTAATWEKRFDDWVTIAAVADADPNMTGAKLDNVKYLRFDGTAASGGYMDVSPSIAGTIPAHNPGDRWTIFYAQNNSGAEFLYFTGLDVFCVDDPDEEGWTAVEWTERVYHGFRLYANDVTITRCLIRNVQSGITNPWSRCVITHNTIDGFSDNGFESGAYHDQTITDNRILNCRSHDDATIAKWGAGQFHPDCIQISGDGWVAKNLNVSRNYINTAYDITTLKGWAQGLFLTSNIEDGVVENNVVMVQNGANACTFGYGATDSDPDGRSISGLLVANNTIVPPVGHGDESYIRFVHNDVGTREDIYVINNITYNPWGDTIDSDGFTWQNNPDAGTLDLFAEFEDYDSGTMTLREGSNLIDAGTSSYSAPTTDLNGNARDATPDIGAYEYDSAEPPTNFPPGRAINPDPENAETDTSIAATLSWSVVSSADNYNLYFAELGDALALVENTTATTYVPTYGLDYSTVYRWRVDPNNDYGTTTGITWTFTTEDDEVEEPPSDALPDPASNPTPSDTATDRLTSLTLSWSSATGAASYKVYFGSTSLTTLGTTTGLSMATGTLNEGTVYQWRVDTINATGTTTGPVWTFTTGTISEPELPAYDSPGVQNRPPKERSLRPDSRSKRYLEGQEALTVVDVVTPDGAAASYTVDENLSGYLERIVIAADGTDAAWSLTIEDSWGGMLFEVTDLDMTGGVVAYDGQRLPFVGGLTVTVADCTTSTANAILVRLYIDETWRR